MTGIEKLTHVQKASFIRAQNDEFRKRLIGGKVMLTGGVVAKFGHDASGLMLAVAGFDVARQPVCPGATTTLAGSWPMGLS